MIMDHGVKSRTMVQCGTHAPWKLAGHLIATDIGTGLARGAGHGWTMRHGVLRHFTMAAGRISTAGGAGARDLFMRVPSTDRRSSALWEEDILARGSDLAADSVKASVGFRLASANRSILGITPATFTFAT